MKQIMVLVMLVVLSSCGTKVKKPIEDVLKEIDSYVSEINRKENISKTSSEGVLTDASGFKDTGKYTLNTYYNKLNNTLYRIENIEITNKVIAENFYFKENDLVFVSTHTNKEAPEKLYIYKDKIINKSNMDSEHQKILLNKASLFKKEFEKATKN
tara:strand:- start:95102 stop:95569 length:468 start_codon:yes stop_codon:yes gene_type:complete